MRISDWSSDVCSSDLLFLPIPLSGFIPAFALFIAGVGLAERDGVVTLLGLAIGLASIAITLVAGITLFLGVQEATSSHTAAAAARLAAYSHEIGKASCRYSVRQYV